MKNELQRCVLLERNDGVNHRQCRQNVTPLLERPDGPAWSFEALDRIVAVHADDEGISFTSCR